MFNLLKDSVMNKTKTFTFIVVLMTSVLMMLSPKQTNAQPFGRVSFELFYQELSPYGYWDRDVNYGDIWFPARVGRDFRPYGTNGYWAMTEYGNTWVSGYAWGWAPFHYGRWVYTSYNGWGWLPGYEWAPAWVDWRSGGGYYGWAPMGPIVNVRVSVGMPLDFWVFIPTRRIYERRMDRYWSYGERNMYNRTTIINNNTYIVNNNYYNGGPGRRDIERSIGHSVEMRSIRAMDSRAPSRVDTRSVSIYQPAGGRDGAPSRVGSGRDDRSTEVRGGSSNNDRTPSRVDAGRGNTRQPETGTTPERSRGDLGTDTRGNTRQPVTGTTPERTRGEVVNETRGNTRNTETPVERRPTSTDRSGSEWGVPSRNTESSGSRVDRSSSRGSEGTVERVRTTESRSTSPSRQQEQPSTPVRSRSEGSSASPVSSTRETSERVQPTRERGESSSSSRGERSSGGGRTR